MSETTSVRTLSTVVGQIGAITERLWGVTVGRASAGAADDVTPRFCASVDELFYVEFGVDETLETVGIRLIGWDRDLTDQVDGPVRVPIGRVDELLTRVSHVIARVTPPPYLDAVHDARNGRARLVSAPVAAMSAEQALERRVVRDLGGDPVAHVDLERIAQLAEQQWTDAEVVRTGAGVTVRPYETNLVSFELDQHGSVDAGVILHADFALGALLGFRLHADNDERSVVLTMAAIDDWLRLSLPGADILARKRLTA